MSFTTLYNIITMTGGAGFSSNMTTSLRNNKKLRNRNHSFRKHEMNLPNAEKQHTQTKASTNVQHHSTIKAKQGIYNKKTIIVLSIIIIVMIIVFILV